MTNTVLATHGLTKNFGALKASQDISIDLKKGEIHAVIGPNGAGKSTLIAQICGTLKPDAGSVEFLGKDVTKESARVRSMAGLGRTFQISALAMEDTVMQNAVLGALGASGKPWRFLKPALSIEKLCASAERALKRVGLEDFIHMTTAELSHGQRRQLEVAVALTLEPKAFVMDEPMAGLGSEGSKRLTGFLGELRDEAPILLVEHDMDAVFALADRITVLVYGKVIATGSVDEIRSNDDVREAYLGDEG
jgi:branched-chain amino acid transport system ATP-binding protein